jgi:hypothetical protein
MITYYDLGANKKLNEIVMGGSHDAGITGGGSNVQTQDLDIAGQAQAGVRLFDIRVAAASMGVNRGLGKEVELKAFHADPKVMKNETKTRFVQGVNRTETITRTKLKGGAFGLSLDSMLDEAKTFVESQDSEFLILKFDKCTSWPLIAERCVDLLAGTLYTGTGNLNTTTLGVLRGKVICLFTQKGLDEIPQQYKNGGGILGIKNLSGGGAYDPQYQGMQYWGKGGTSIFKPFGKVSQNEKKQAKLMSGGAGSNPEVMGMMYWTTTGVSESIRKRNDTMWKPKNVTGLKKMWCDGLAESIETRLASHVDPLALHSAPILKTFMPNIVMIDFANDERCREIYSLNTVAAVELTYAARFLDLEMRRGH